MKKSLFLGIAASAAVFAAPLSLSDAISMAKANNSQIKAEKAKVDMAESGQAEARSRFMPQLTLTASVTKINDPIYIDLNQIRTGMIQVHGAEAYQSYYSQYYSDYYKQYYDQAYNAALAQGADEATATATAKQAADKAGEQAGTKAGNEAKDKTVEKLEESLPSFEKKVQDDVFFNARLTAIWPIFTGFKIYSAYDAAKENVNAKKAAFDMAQNTILMDVATKYFTLRLAEELTVLRESTKKNLE